MTQTLIKNDVMTLNKLMTLEEFLDWYPDGYGRFELHKGEIIEMQPTGTHEQIIGFIGLKLSAQIDKFNLDYFLAQNSILKPIDSDNSGYKPDIMLIDKAQLNNEPMWQKRSTIIRGETIPLVIEVVSTNWHDDYAMKLEEYEKLGISEYWIVDYLGLGGKRYIGNPKQPTISIYNLIDGEYQVKFFRENDRLESLVFPELNLTVKEIIM